MKRQQWSLVAASFLGGLACGALAFGDWINGMDEAPRAGDERIGMAAASVAVAADPSAGAAQDATLSQRDGETPEPAPGQMPDQAHWQDLDARLARMQERLTRLEHQVAAQASRSPAIADARPAPPRTAGERRERLVAAGVAPGLADDILWQESQQALARLTLRDQAVREGWIGTAEYRAALAELDADARGLREQIGEAAYDRYLFASGADNRVRVTSVITGSAAEAAGLLPGDLIETYAEAPVFDFHALRARTAEGEAGEWVPLRVRRDGRPVESWVPRGPLGVTLEATRAQPY